MKDILNLLITFRNICYAKDSKIITADKANETFKSFNDYVRPLIDTSECNAETARLEI